MAPGEAATFPAAGSRKLKSSAARAGDVPPPQKNAATVAIGHEKRRSPRLDACCLPAEGATGAGPLVVADAARGGSRFAVAPKRTHASGAAEGARVQQAMPAGCGHT